MLKAGRSFGRFVDGCRRRAGTPSARFKLALSSGFVVASIGMATVVIGQAGQAEDFFGAFGSLFSAPQTAPPSYQFGVTRAFRNPRVADGARIHSRRSRVADQPSASHHRRVLASAGQGEDGASPMRLGRASICVRSCDGFAFPVGAFHGEGDLAAHEATCRSECPGAQTSLYVLPTGSSEISEAVEARTGRAYSQKVAGFHYTTYLDESCSCHPKAGNRVASLLRDFTLRRGDAVITTSGVKVFHGGGHFPYRQADFVGLAQSPDVKKAALTSFRAIERVSMVTNRPAIAQAGPFRAPSASLKKLEHDAALVSSDH